LGIGVYQTDLEFGLSLLDYMRHTENDGDPGLAYSTWGSDGHKRVRDLYVFLEAQIRASGDGKECKRNCQVSIAPKSTLATNWETFGSNAIHRLLIKTRDRFDDELIFIPAGYRSEEDRANWVFREDCVWAAPVRHPRYTYALDGLYARMPGEPASTSNGSSLKSFFSSVVDVSKWDWRLAIDELEAHKQGNANFDCIMDHYKWLSKNISGDTENIRYVHIVLHT
jgi:hypothetical protein